MSPLLKLANRFDKLLAQMSSAQPSDIENALKAAGLWELSNDIAALPVMAQVPNDVGIAINIVVNAGLAVTFSVELNPPNPQTSQALAGMLQRKYSAAMTKALQTANLNVADTVAVKWLTF